MNFQRREPMKRVLILILVVAMAFTGPFALAQCPSAAGRNLVLTEGVAEVMGQNDSARLSIAVVTEGQDLEEVSAENAQSTLEVLRAIKGLKIENLRLKTTGYRVSPQRDYKVRPPKIKGYEVYNAIECVLEGLEPIPLSTCVSRIIEETLERGANDVNGMAFYIKDKGPLEKRALTQATKEAMARAKTLAEAAGVRLKELVSLSTQPMDMPPEPRLFRGTDMKEGSRGVAPPVEVGESKVRVQVSIAYEVE
jgi:hypothetical protein